MIEEIFACHNARISTTYLVTTEEKRAENSLLAFCLKRDGILLSWSLNAKDGLPGWEMKGPKDLLAQDRFQTFAPLVNEIIEFPGAGVIHNAVNHAVQEIQRFYLEDVTLRAPFFLVLKDVGQIINDSPHLIRALKDTPDAFRMTRASLVCISEHEKIPIELRASLRTIFPGLPSRNVIERHIFAELGRHGIEIQHLDRDALIDSCCGLTLAQASDILAMSISRFRGEINIEFIGKKKAEVLSSIQGVKYEEALCGMTDIGGFENLKDWVEKRREGFTQKAKDFGLNAPKGVLCLGIPGCLHGDTPIYDPITRETLSVKERYLQGKNFHVLSLDLREGAPGKTVIAEADSPHLYAPAEMIEFTTDRGDTFKVTKGHRFWNGTHWQTASEVFEQLSLSSDVLLPSSSESCQPAPLVGALHLRDTKEGYPYDCRNDPHFGDEQLLWNEVVGQLPSPSQVDVLEYTHEHLNQGQESLTQQYIKIVKAVEIGKEEYYDFCVPIYENYAACGMWHHNTGKTLFSKAVAAAFEAPLISLQLQDLKEGIVGATESNIRVALNAIESLGKCVVRLDEMEKSITGKAGQNLDGGTSDAILGSILRWLQDRKPGAFVVATCNDISALPPELLRKGRWDEIFFVDLPTKEERQEIFEIHLKKVERTLPSEKIELLAIKSEGYSGAEIEAAIAEGLWSAFGEEERELTPEDILAALTAQIPLSKTMEDKVKDLQQWAKNRARPVGKNSLPSKKEKKGKLPSQRPMTDQKPRAIILDDEEDDEDPQA